MRRQSVAPVRIVRSTTASAPIASPFPYVSAGRLAPRPASGIDRASDGDLQVLYAARGAPIILLTANHILSPRVGFPRTKNVGGAYKKVAGCFDGKVDKFGAFQISFTVRVQSELVATVAGEPPYSAYDFSVIERIAVPTSPSRSPVPLGKAGPVTSRWAPRVGKSIRSPRGHGLSSGVGSPAIRNGASHPRSLSSPPTSICRGFPSMDWATRRPGTVESSTGIETRALLPVSTFRFPSASRWPVSSRDCGSPPTCPRPRQRIQRRDGARSP